MLPSEKPEPLVRYRHQIRSRYAETDKMGYVYHGRFVEYCETARTEFIRKAGVTYKMMEDNGVMMPVVEVSLRFHKPVFYDELVDVWFYVFDEPSTRLETFYEIRSFGEKQTLKVSGKIMLCFVNMETGRPCPAPEYFTEKIQAYRQKHG